MASIERRETSRGVRYDVRYRDVTGRQREKAFRRKADADRFARTVEADKDRGLFVDPRLARTPLATVAAEWLASNPGKRGGTRDRDEQVVNGHIVPALGDRAVGSLTPADVQSAVNAWAAKRSARTVQREYAVLRAILNYAVQLDMIGRTPCRGINLPAAKRVKPHIVTPAEVAALAAGLGGTGDLGPMVYVGAVAGLRWGEVAGLRVGDVDRVARTLVVAQTVVRGRHGRIGFGAPKSEAGWRSLAVPAELVGMLVEHVEARGLTMADRHALLFTAPGGGFLRYSNWVRRRWYPAAIAAGVGRMVEVEDGRNGAGARRQRYAGLGFHDLRRANATELLAAGVDIKTAQTWLGHSEARLTLDLYAQAVTELGEAAAQRLGAKFLPMWGERGVDSGDEGDDTPPDAAKGP